jgi:lysophospholipase L1-like esterase
VALTAGLVLLGGCAGTAASGTPSPPSTSGSRTAPPTATPHAGAWSVVALGDSVPAGAGCDCTPYPQLSASLLTVPEHHEVAATNDAVSGATSSDVLASVTSDPGVESHVAASDVVEVEVGANDVGFSSTCGTTVDCYAPTVPTIERNLTEIVTRVHALAQGHRVIVVLLDYWSVWLGGAYAEAQGQAYVDAATAMTDQVNAVIRRTANATGSAYVDLRAAFKGPDYSYDETHYLAPDGDHPNASGHEQIARALVDVVGATVHP